MRLLASSKPLPLDKLGMSDRNLRALREIVSKPYGIFLCVGPTGSGKTTTLHSCVGSINTPDRKICTVEDPVEITQRGLRQVQINLKKDVTFANSMRAFLRADPDVIMVGEMRDHETAGIGIEASLTGHLVLSTLHTNSAPETITRLLDMDLDPFNFSDALLGILAQRLTRTLCKCKEAYHPDSTEFEELAHLYGPEHWEKLGIEYNDSFALHRPKGCAECNDTGYKGRMGIHELLFATRRGAPVHLDRFDLLGPQILELALESDVDDRRRPGQAGGVEVELRRRRIRDAGLDRGCQARGDIDEDVRAGRGESLAGLGEPLRVVFGADHDDHDRRTAGRADPLDQRGQLAGRVLVGAAT